MVLIANIIFNVIQQALFFCIIKYGLNSVYTNEIIK